MSCFCSPVIAWLFSSLFLFDISVAKTLIFFKEHKLWRVLYSGTNILDIRDSLVYTALPSSSFVRSSHELGHSFCTQWGLPQPAFVHPAHVLRFQDGRLFWYGRKFACVLASAWCASSLWKLFPRSNKTLTPECVFHSNDSASHAVVR